MRTTLIIGLLAVSGCGWNVPRKAELRTADYGSPISQADAEKSGTAYLNAILLDPESMRVKWGVVELGWWKKLGQWGYTFGYILDGWINAKNRYGGYTGAQRYTFCFRDQKFVYYFQH